MNTSVSSISPAELTSCRCVPSPQSNRMRSPPRRTSSDGSPRRAVGIEPAVPAKNTDRSTSRSVSAELDQPEVDLTLLHPGHAHGVNRLAPALGRAAGVEDLKAIAGVLVQGDVRMAEDNGGGAR